MNYPIVKNKKTNTLHPSNSNYSDEYAQKMCDLYLSDEVHTGNDGKLHRYYRLHAKLPHSIEDALTYDIKCPGCGQRGTLKQVGRVQNCYDLGLYRCPICEKI